MSKQVWHTDRTFLVGITWCRIVDVDEGIERIYCSWMALNSAIRGLGGKFFYVQLVQKCFGDRGNVAPRVNYLVGVDTESRHWI